MLPDAAGDSLVPPDRPGTTTGTGNRRPGPRGPDDTGHACPLSVTLVPSFHRYGLDGAWNASDHSSVDGSSIVPIAPHRRTGASASPPARPCCRRPTRGPVLKPWVANKLRSGRRDLPGTPGRLPAWMLMTAGSDRASPTPRLSSRMPPDAAAVVEGCDDHLVMPGEALLHSFFPALNAIRILLVCAGIASCWDETPRVTMRLGGCMSLTMGPSNNSFQLCLWGYCGLRASPFPSGPQPSSAGA